MILNQSEYISTGDQRIHYVSGFSGSAGTVVITLHEALLWTDSRYHIQADEQLYENWTLKRSGLFWVFFLIHQKPNEPKIFVFSKKVTLVSKRIRNG